MWFYSHDSILITRLISIAQSITTCEFRFMSHSNRTHNKIKTSEINCAFCFSVICQTKGRILNISRLVLFIIITFIFFHQNTIKTHIKNVVFVYCEVNLQNDFFFCARCIKMPIFPDQTYFCTNVCTCSYEMNYKKLKRKKKRAIEMKKK